MFMVKAILVLPYAILSSLEMLPLGTVWRGVSRQEYLDKLDSTFGNESLSKTFVNPWYQIASSVTIKPQIEFSPFVYLIFQWCQNNRILKDLYFLGSCLFNNKS